MATAAGLFLLGPRVNKLSMQRYVGSLVTLVGRVSARPSGTVVQVDASDGGQVTITVPSELLSDIKVPPPSDSGAAATTTTTAASASGASAILQLGSIVEVVGKVNQDMTMVATHVTCFADDFDLGTYESLIQIMQRHSDIFV
ncbi:hypothetical protein Pelo_14584 [Pelomyxa schiedti]|nr:hypothetical protein Pelo_14584 [Pelomyxa schiedti]